LIELLNSVTQALENNPYVVVIALDFSKAFNTVRHSSAMAKWLSFNYRIACTTGWSISSTDTVTAHGLMVTLQTYLM